MESTPATPLAVQQVKGDLSAMNKNRDIDDSRRADKEREHVLLHERTALAKAVAARPAVEAHA